jgi:hypothetical protein
MYDVLPITSSPCSPAKKIGSSQEKKKGKFFKTGKQKKMRKKAQIPVFFVDTGQRDRYELSKET